MISSMGQFHFMKNFETITFSHVKKDKKTKSDLKIPTNKGHIKSWNSRFKNIKKQPVTSCEALSKRSDWPIPFVTSSEAFFNDVIEIFRIDFSMKLRRAPRKKFGGGFILSIGR
uniref:Uncharacterized protein n=1 Tax=Cacopsylla melanoneura TaxID=428564 RepID=A0A8D8SM21_9HEMI